MVRTVERDKPVRRTDTREDVVTDSEDRGPRKIEDFVWFLVAAVSILIFIRFVLLLFGARTGVPFVDFWYGLTVPLITPFAGMFGTIDTFNVYTGQRIEIESLVAILVYALIGYLIVLGIRLFRKEPRSE